MYAFKRLVTLVVVHLFVRSRVNIFVYAFSWKNKLQFPIIISILIAIWYNLKMIMQLHNIRKIFMMHN